MWQNANGMSQGNEPVRSAQCARSAKEGRRSTRWEHEGLLDEMAERVRDNPQVMKQRKEIVEHPFGRSNGR
ncbi:MAG: hypothetical protein M3R24_18120 [Chloroflexota bacterium]|nr:hypothetical protein [Chloroflexota bacterium]